MFRRVSDTIRTQLTQGLELVDCVRAIAVALTIAIFPIMGFSTWINLGAAAALRLNHPVVQAVNWLSAPLKFALIFPFLRLGEWLFGAEPFTLSLVQFSEIFFADWIGTTQAFAMTFVHAIAGWLVCMPLIFLALNYLIVPAVMKPVVAGWREAGRMREAVAGTD